MPKIDLIIQNSLDTEEWLCTWCAVALPHKKEKNRVCPNCNHKMERKSKSKTYVQNLRRTLKEREGVI